jgi:quinohemoprotein ethanol dehydrogenase
VELADLVPTEVTASPLTGAARWLPIALIAVTLGGCGSDEPSAPSPTPAATSEIAGPAAVDTARAADAASEPHNWMLHGRTYAEQRFSPLDEINTATIGDLGLAWYWDGDYNRGYEGTPIVVDGVMYVSTSWSIVYALDARTGTQLWKYDPAVDRGRASYYACCDVVNRGVAVWQGRVYVGVLDGRLVALDADTGEVDWEVVTLDQSGYATITGAPRIVKDRVIIGNGGAEYGARGYITAYHTETGAELWRFYTVPGNPSQPPEGEHLAKALPTWHGDFYWRVGGGGTVWDAMAYDPELDLLYVGTGNGSPWNRVIRSPGGGDNLYLASIVAIDPDDGAMTWHYQTTPADTWDYTATQHMILADLEIDGTTRKVIMQAPKNGFFYMLDRADGTFISAEPFAEVTWATHVDPETGRPVENPERHYWDAPKVISPSPLGAHNWQPMSFSPRTGLVYIPARLDTAAVYAHPASYELDPDRPFGTGMDRDWPDHLGPLPPDEAARLKDDYGALMAWDPIAQREAWRVEHEGPWNGGTMATAGGLVFQGHANGELIAYRDDTGAKVWSHQTQRGVLAAPISYAIDGEQYIAVLAGWGGGPGRREGSASPAIDNTAPGRLVAYKLGGSQSLPPLPDRPPQVVSMPPPTADAATLAVGARVYRTHCGKCHSPAPGGALPDLRFMSAAADSAFLAIVRQGAYAPVGMPNFGELISEEEAVALHQFVRSMAHASAAPEPSSTDDPH